jgi:hypothetical protein
METDKPSDISNNIDRLIIIPEYGYLVNSESSNVAASFSLRLPRRLTVSGVSASQAKACAYKFRS